MIWEKGKPFWPNWSQNEKEQLEKGIQAFCDLKPVPIDWTLNSVLGN